MTREEAIKGLTSLVEVRRKYVGIQTMKDEIECLDMAIKALETASCIKEKCAYCPHCEHCDVDDETLEIKALEQEPKTGHWIEVTNGRGGHECDLCHEYAPSYKDGDEWLTKYCHSCGARMEGDKE